MLQFVFADQCNVHRDNGMAYFDLIPKLGKARYIFLCPQLRRSCGAYWFGPVRPVVSSESVMRE